MDESRRKIEICRDQLLAAVRTRSICTRYEKCRDALNAVPELKAKADDFRRRSFESQGGLTEGEDIESRHRLFRERQELNNEPLIRDFLVSELEMGRLLQNLCLSIIGVTDLGVDALFDNHDGEQG